MSAPITRCGLFALACCLLAGRAEAAPLAVRGETIYTMSGPAIQDGVVLIRGGKIAAIGAADAVDIPDDCEVVEAKVVTPGLIDAHSTVGLSGIYNYAHDQDQLERSSPIQPELRAIDAYNSREPLIDWVRRYGITTLHTGHAPGELISGQTMVVKTAGNTVEDATLREQCALAATLAASAQKGSKQSPGTRAKMIAMLRSQLIKAQEYRDKQQANADEDQDEGPSRNLRLEVLVKVLDGELPLMITAYRAQDIASALRLAEEFDLKIWLDGAAEAYLLIDELKAAGTPVILHPQMARPIGDLKNMSVETASQLIEAGLTVVFQSGYEPYVPKTRIVLFEAAIAAANGLSFEQALGSITRDAAELLGVADRVGTLEVGKDGDVALFDGDPLEYTTHCTGVAIDGELFEFER